MTPAEIKEFLNDRLDQIDTKQTEVINQHKELDGRIGKIDDEMKTRGEETVETKTAFQAEVEKVAKLEADMDELVKKGLGNMPGTEQPLSFAATVAKSEAAANYKSGNIELAEWQGNFVGNKKAALTSDPASAGATIEPLLRAGIIYDPDQPLVIRDLLQTIPISTNAMEWVQEKTFTNNAAPQETEGDLKAESAITFEKKSGTVETLAHWMPMSRQVLADNASLQSFVDMKMRYGLALVEETQLLYGDGTNGNLEGLVPQAIAYNKTDPAASTRIDRLRRAALQVTEARYPTNGFVMSPADWCEIELTKDANRGYIFANPVNGTTPRLWGKRVVESMSMTTGSWLAGAFNMAATLWDRELVTARVAEQHADFFVRNMVVLLVEERIGLTVERPAAIVKGNFTFA